VKLTTVLNHRGRIKAIFFIHRAKSKLTTILFNVAKLRLPISYLRQIFKGVGYEDNNKKIKSNKVRKSAS